MSDKIGSKANYLHHHVQPPTINESSPLKRVLSAAVSIRHPDQNGDSPSPSLSPQTSPVSANRTLISSGGSHESYRRNEEWNGSDGEDNEDTGHGDGKAVARVKELWSKLGRKSREGSTEDVSPSH